MIRFIAYVWLGLVLGVSFLATPVKFRAKSLTRPVALDVGRTTFHAFGKLEWLLSVALVVITVAVRDSLKPLDWFLIALVLVIVVGQTLWLIHGLMSGFRRSSTARCYPVHICTASMPVLSSPKP